MPTLTLQDKVQDYVGTVSDTSALTEWLSSGIRLLVNIIPEKHIYKYSAEEPVTTAGLDISSKRLVRAHKNDYGCRFIEPRYKAQVQNSGSLHYAISTDPVAILDNKKIYVYPNGGTAVTVSYPTVLFSTETPISNFPLELEDALVIGTALKVLYNRVNTGFDSIVAPSAPSAPTFTYTDALQGVYTATTIATLATAPVYTKITSPTIDFANANIFINTDEDVELANAELGQIKTKLENFQMEMYNELNEFNSQSLEYNAELQKKIQQAQLDQQRLLQVASETTDLNLANEAKELERQIAQYASSLQKYQAEIAKYQGDVAKTVQQMGNYVNLMQALKAEYNAIIQTYVNS